MDQEHKETFEKIESKVQYAFNFDFLTSKRIFKSRCNCSNPRVFNGYANKKATILIVIILLIASLFPFWVADHKKFLVDDAYITLTYVKSLSQGKGFVLNHPPPTLGTTTPLFTFITAGVSKIFPDFDLAKTAVLLSTLFWVGIGWLFFLFRHSLDINEWQACIIGLVIFVSSWMEYLYLGMELYLFAFLLVLSMALFCRGHTFLTGISTGLLFLTRGEGVLVLGICILHCMVQTLFGDKKDYVQTVKALLVMITGFLLPLLPWFIYAYFTFGHVFSITLSAKMAQGQGHLAVFPLGLFTFWIPMWGNYTFIFDKLPFLSILWLWLLFFLGVGSAIVRKHRWLFFIVWIAAYIGGYSLLKVADYAWYNVPTFFVIQIFVSLGIIACVEIILRHKRPFAAQMVAVAFVILMIALLSRPTIQEARTKPGTFRTKFYLNIAKWFRENAKPSDSIACVEIGYLAYHTENRIIDLAGLTIPEIVPYVAKGDYGWGFWYYKPDYYISPPFFRKQLGPIESNPEFARQYVHVTTLPSWWKGGKGFLIYKRIKNTKT